MSLVGKRSISVGGSKTSVSLEDEFWEGLRQIAQARKISMAGLIAEIDRKRSPDSNLSSAIRVFILDDYVLRARIVTAQAA